MKNKKIVFGLCGSFCNMKYIIDEIKNLSKENELLIVTSEQVYHSDTRFYKAQDLQQILLQYTHHPIIHTVVEAEKIGPMNCYDMMVIAPMSATVCSKLVHGIYDHPVTLAAKAMLRNKKNIIFGIATNDALGISGKNLFSLLNYRHMYCIPFFQDDPIHKETSLISKWSLIERTCELAEKGEQIQPILWQNTKK